MDTLLQSFENLLNYTDADHNADHENGFCSEKVNCVTCNWLVDANKNYSKLLDLVGK